MRRALPFLFGPIVLLAQGQGRPEIVDPDPARKFFLSGLVVHITLDLEPADRQKLRDRPREYVPATVRLDGDKSGWSNVGVKLKGAAGSFRKIDERPGFTFNLGKFGGTERLHGLRRFHLNNGVQDDTWLCEWLGSELFTAAGYPAPRVAHALVWLDGKELGLYVLREGFDEQFLRRAFGTTAGSLYDGGFCKDIDRQLEKDAGDGPDDRSDLGHLRAVCESFDGERAARLESVLDVDAFVDFMALEAMVGHWDGYSNNRNNFRLWCQAQGQAHFLPHGMDQLFGDADASVLDHPSAIAASAVHRHAAWRKLYRKRLTALLPLFRPGKLVKKVQARAARLQKELRAIDRELASSHKRAVRKLIGRIEARYKSLKKQVKASEPAPLAFRGEQPVRLERWNTAGETDHIMLRKRSYRGTPALHIACTSRGDKERRGAFRTSVLLERGKYRVLALARCEDVELLRKEDGTLHGGVQLTIDKKQSDSLGTDTKWTELSCDFEVADYRDNVELRLELRARDGKAWFRTDSLKIQRLENR